VFLKIMDTTNRIKCGSWPVIPSVVISYNPQSYSKVP
jgi:hypothetical protein